MTDKVLYFGYGTNRDARMIAAILGKPESELVGYPAVLEGYELGLQTISQVADVISPTAPVKVSPQGLLRESWGEGFTSYVVRTNPLSEVSGTIWELSHDERERIRDWELIDFGWYEDCVARARTAEGIAVDVVTERIGHEQPIERLVDGADYPTWLDDIRKFMLVAEKARREYDERLSGPGGGIIRNSEMKNI